MLLGALVSTLALTAASTVEAQNRKVTIAYGVAVVDPSTAPWLSAGSTGKFWQEEGLDVTVTGFNGASPAMQVLAQGQADFTVAGTPDMMVLRENGVAIKCVANIYDTNHVYPVTLEGSPIKTIADFRGKKVGMQTLTGSVRVWTDVLLKAHGMTLADLGAAIPVGTGAPAVQAIRSGQVDILVEWHGHYALLETQFGLKFNRFDKDPVLKENAFVHCLHTSERMIQNDPKTVEAVIRGMTKGILMSKENPKAVVRGHFEQFPRTLPQGVPLEEAIDKAAQVVALNVTLSTTTAEAGEWGISTQEQVERVRDQVKQAGIIKQALPWENYYSPQFIKAANTFDREALTKRVREMK